MNDDSPFGVLINTEGTLEEVKELTLNGFQGLLAALEQLKHCESRYFTEAHSVLIDDFARLSGTVNELQAELLRIGTQHANCTQEINRLRTENEEAQVRAETANLRLAMAGNPTDCKCPCRCGSRTSDEAKEKENQDQIEINSLLSDYKGLKKQLDKEIRRKSQFEMELEVSEERFIKTRAFKHLLYESKDLYAELQKYKQRYYDIVNYKEDSENRKNNDIKGILDKEDLKRETLKEKLAHNYAQISQLEIDKVKLTEELEILTQNLSTQNKTTAFTDLIDTYEKELQRKTAQHKQLAEQLLKTQTTNPTAHSAAPQDEITRLNQQLQNEKATSEALMAELGVMESAFGDLMMKNKNLTLQLNAHENSYTQVMNERVKETNWRTLNEREKETMQEAIHQKELLLLTLRDTNEQLLNSIEARDALVRELENRLAQTEASLTEISELNNRDYRKSREISELKDRYIACINELTAKQGGFHRERAELEIKITQLNTKIDELEHKLIENDSLENLKSTDERLNDEVKKYRGMIRCSQCSLRIKDVVINKCFHAFCKKCIHENYEQRKRKCPHCKTKFGLDDVKLFWWA